MEVRKGFYFSLDAVVALMIMSASMILVMQVSSNASSDFKFASSEYEKLGTSGRDSMKLASAQDLNVLNESLRDEIRPTVGDEAMDKSILNGISLLWARGNRSAASKVAKAYFGDRIPKKYEYAVNISESGKDYLIYSSKKLEGAPKIVTSSSTLVSGHMINRSSTGYRARALLTSVDKNATKRVFIGGYVGQGNITYNVSLDDPRSIKNVTLKADVSSNFTLDFNGQDAGSYDAKGEQYAVEKYQICTEGDTSCEALEQNQNKVRFHFTGDNRSIRGGVLRIKYDKTSDIKLEGPEYRIGKKKLPGIEGIINYYGGFYIPGQINEVSAHLNFTVDNRTVFLRAGNTTLYREREDGDTEVELTNQEISDAFESSGIQLEDLSRRTIPLRLGLGDISTEAGERQAIADSVSVMDVSGSMEGDRLASAKNASKLFVDTILEADGNNVGFVSYNEDVVDTHDLSKDKNSVKNLIDSQTAGGNTCIGCGILESTDILQGTRVLSKVKKGDVWKYNTENLDSKPPQIDGEDWNSVNYDDSSWNQSDAPISSEGADPELESYEGSVYLRKQFNLNHSKFSLDLGLYTNDNASVYLNGQLVYNGTVKHLADYWNSEISVEDAPLRSGGNVVAVKLENSENDTERARENQETGWDGSFVNSSIRNGKLQLTPQFGTGQDVNADQYTQITGDGYGGSFPFTYESYIQRVQVRGIDSPSDNEGYRDATNQVTDELVPGRSYRINVTVQTGDGSLFSSVAFDWNDNGNWDDSETALEVGSCSGNPCTVSKDIRIPKDAETGSTLMRVMAQEGEYHLDPTSENTLNEAEDYTAFIDRPKYYNGSYTTQLEASNSVNWSDKNLVAEIPEKTSVDLNYTVEGTSYKNISQVPNSENVTVKASIYTDSGNSTPRIEEFSLGYPIDQSEAAFDAYLNLTENRKKSMVVMSDGAPNTETNMQNVPNHYEGNDFCFGNTCYPVIGGPEHAIEAACRAQDNQGIKVYSVGFGDANEEIMGQIAECGGGEYYSASTSNLEDVFSQISNQILEASYIGQTVKEGSTLSKSVLSPDSYIKFNYTDPKDLEYGEITLRRVTERFGGEVKSPKEETLSIPNSTLLDIPQDTEVDSAKVTSYSGNRWTYTVEANGTGEFETVFNLTNYGSNFPAIGDPFNVNIPEKHITVGTNAVRVDTALSPGESSGGSPANRAFYTMQIGNSVGYGPLFPNETEAKENARKRLKEKLDFDGDGEPIVNVESDDFRTSSNVLGDEPYLWGPANVKLVIWSNE